MLVWKILCISNIIFNVFASLTLGMAVYRVYKQKKKLQPIKKTGGNK